MSIRNQKRQVSLSKKKTHRINKKNNSSLKISNSNSEINYLLQIAYDGSTYGGYAKQKFPNTISNQLEIALFKTLNETVKTQEASRTDSKVHAIDQKVAFKTTQKLESDKFLTKLNLNLPDSIYAASLLVVPYEFHPQYAAKNKTYRFKIHTKFDLFLTKYSYFWDQPQSLTDEDIEKINTYCSVFIGEHDFSGFSSAKSDTSISVRTVNFFSFAKYNKNHLFFEINADGFLYNMIRILVPTILRAFDNNESIEQLQALLESQDRKQAASTIAGNGLYLHQVNFK